MKRVTREQCLHAKMCRRRADLQLADFTDRREHEVAQLVHGSFNLYLRGTSHATAHRAHVTQQQHSDHNVCDARCSVGKRRARHTPASAFGLSCRHLTSTSLPPSDSRGPLAPCCTRTQSAPIRKSLDTQRPVAPVVVHRIHVFASQRLLLFRAQIVPHKHAAMVAVGNRQLEVLSACSEQQRLIRKRSADIRGWAPPCSAFSCMSWFVSTLTSACASACSAAAKCYNSSFSEKQRH
jgi:hypothetical protein